MLRISSFFLGAVTLLQVCNQAWGMECKVLGFGVNCPTSLDDSDKAFCCVSSVSDSLEYCCDIEDYVKQNAGILVGILVAVLVLLIICTLCCCCFCSCCLLAKRRTNRGQVLRYGPVAASEQVSVTTTTFASPSVVHPPPLQNPPPAYYPPANYQPPQNPHFKH